MTANAWAQTGGDVPVEQSESETEAEQEIVVSGKSVAGKALGVLPPELQLNQDEVASYGVSNVSELIQELSVLTRSSRGRGGNRPVILVNGQRTASENEVRELPTEAIRRVDVLSEEAALQYGYSADQRVLNLVLQKDFRALTLRSDGSTATDGGRQGRRGEVGFLSTSDSGRWSLGLDYQHDTMLLESERDLQQPTPAVPYGFAGVFAPATAGASLDPALDSTAGIPVRYARVPAGAASVTPSLSALLPLANLGEAIDTGSFRSLVPDQKQLRLTASVNRRVGASTYLTLSGLFEEQKRKSLLGLADISILLPAGSPFSPFAGDALLLRFAAQPRQRDVTDRTIDIGAGLAGNWGEWQWSITGQYEKIRSDRETLQGFDTAWTEASVAAADPAFNPYRNWAATADAPPVFTRDRVTKTRWDADFVINGRGPELPAGEATTSLKIGFDSSRLSQAGSVTAVPGAMNLKRDRILVQGNVDVPIIAEGISAVFPGTLTLNGNADWRDLSDFGSLFNFGAGINWQPLPPIRISASFNREQAAPDLADLGSPTLTTPAYRIFDYVAGETVEVVRIDGGNPGLTSDRRKVVKLGVVAEPLVGSNLTLSADYVWQRTANPVRSFPVATPEILAAFPGRFLRNSEGRLVQIDVRPVNLSSLERKSLRLGATWQGRMGNRPGASGARPSIPGRDRGDRLQLSIFHEMTFADRLTISTNGPVFDYLGGSALNDRGGQPRHEVQLRAGVNKSGIGLRMEADWLAATRVNGVSASDDLRFSDYLMMNMRLFGNIERIPPANRTWAKGMRLSLEVRNLLNSRPVVTTVADTPRPLAYQPAYLEPIGRTIRLSIRKQL